jgi:Cys-tRNA(Pro)/Cys-tRNA(Cys) deacylase
VTNSFSDCRLDGGEHTPQQDFPPGYFRLLTEPVSRASTPAIAALLAAGAPHEVLRYHHDPRSQSYGEEAVAALAGDSLVPEQIFKTLIIAAGPVLAVAVLPVPWKLSLKAAAAALGLAKVAMADQAAAERATGYVLGGISPLGQRKRLPTVVDSSALSFSKVLCSAGKRGWDVALCPQDLVRLTDAVTADLRAV